MRLAEAFGILSFAALVLAVAPAPLAAQRILVVDQGGSGQFTAIQPAIDAAQPGDVVRVLPATTAYAGFQVDKSLSVVGGPGVRVTGTSVATSYSTFHVRGLRRGDVVVVHGFEEQYPSPYGIGTVIEDNAGAVHFSDVRSIAFALIRNCRQLSFDGCALEAVQVQASNVLFEATTARGYPNALGGLVQHALIAGNGSRLTIAGGAWIGSDELFAGYRPPGPGIILQADAKLTLTGDDTTVVRGGQGIGGAPAINVWTNAELVLDPDPQLIPTGSQPPITGFGRVVSTRVPYLRTHVESGELHTVLGTWPGAQVWLFASPFAPPPLSLPGTLAQLWTTEPLLVASGTMVTKRRVDRFPLPPLLPGTALPLQAAVANGGTLALSNAVVQVLSP